MSVSHKIDHKGRIGVPTPCFMEKDAQEVLSIWINKDEIVVLHRGGEHNPLTWGILISDAIQNIALRAAEDGVYLDNKLMTESDIKENILYIIQKENEKPSGKVKKWEHDA